MAFYLALKPQKDMKACILIVLITFFPTAGKSQIRQQNDSLMSQVQMLLKLDNRLKILNNRQSELYQDVDGIEQQLSRQFDSLRQRILQNDATVNVLQFRIDSLESEAQVYRSEYRSDINALREEIHRLKVGNVTIFIVLFLIMTGFFVYFFYGDVKLEKMINVQFSRNTIETERQIKKLSGRWKERFTRMNRKRRKKKK